MKGRFDKSVLRSTLGLCLGDIRFAEIQTTIKKCMVCLKMFMKFIEQGSFNADNLPLDSCSCTTAILLAFISDRHLEDIESVAIGNMGVLWGTYPPLIWLLNLSAPS